MAIHVETNSEKGAELVNCVQQNHVKPLSDGTINAPNPEACLMFSYQAGTSSTDSLHSLTPSGRTFTMQSTAPTGSYGKVSRCGSGFMQVGRYGSAGEWEDHDREHMVLENDHFLWVVQKNMFQYTPKQAEFTTSSYITRWNKKDDTTKHIPFEGSSGSIHYMVGPTDADTADNTYWRVCGIHFRPKDDNTLYMFYVWTKNYQTMTPRIYIYELRFVTDTQGANEHIEVWFIKDIPLSRNTYTNYYFSFKDMNDCVIISQYYDSSDNVSSTADYSVILQLDDFTIQQYTNVSGMLRVLDRRLSAGSFIKYDGGCYFAPQNSPLMIPVKLITLSNTNKRVVVDEDRECILREPCTTYDWSTAHDSKNREVIVGYLTDPKRFIKFKKDTYDDRPYVYIFEKEPKTISADKLAFINYLR